MEKNFSWLPPNQPLDVMLKSAIASTKMGSEKGISPVNA